MKNEILKIIGDSKSWSNIHTKLVVINNQNSTLAGSLFELFCKLYFLHEPSISSDYKNVWLFNETPQNIKDKLGLSRTDYGVDLILEDNQSKLSVVQCKFRNYQSGKLSWTKDKIANLFAEGDKAEYFIVFTNSSGLDKHSKSKKENKFRLFTLADLLDIQSETFEKIALSIKDSIVAPLQKAVPRDYQQLAISKVIDGFKKNNRGQLILPCGAGKTLTALWIKEYLKPKHTLVLVPSLALLRQIKNEWHKHQANWIPYLSVCSESDINKNLDSDVPMVHTYEIGGNVTTNPEEIRNFLLSQPETIIFATYQSLDAIQKAIQDTKFSFDLALCDEAHKTAGSKMSAFGLIHDQSKIPVQKRLYMTATPRIISVQEKSKLSKETVSYLADMSDSSVFGTEFHRMSFKEAIDQKILVDYQILAVGVSDEELQKAILTRQFIGDNTTIDDLANNFALQKTMKKYGAKHAITFHSSIKKAESFKNNHKLLYPEILTNHVSGKQTTNDRKTILDEFEKSNNAVVTNARCLTEGVDVPGIDLVYFCDPKNSKIDIVQATGRALRRSDHAGKKIGYVVVPIFHSTTAKLEEMIENSAFKNLVSIVRALCDHDERLQAEITKIKLGEGLRKPLTSSLHLNIEDEIPLIKLENFENKLKESLFLNVVEKITLPWRSFEEARQFVHSLGIKSETEWRKYYKGNLLVKGIKPYDIPSDPPNAYKNKGWVTWGDWLGTGRIQDQQKVYLPFEEARTFVRILNLRNQHEWIRYSQGKLLKKGTKPDSIPANPNQVYKEDGWLNLGDWLGTGTIGPGRHKYRPFLEARLFARSLNLKSRSEWSMYSKEKKLPSDIPTAPNAIYRDKGWVGMGDWLGTNSVAPGLRKYRSFTEAREFARALKLSSRTEWIQHKSKIPFDIPLKPDRRYKKEGWVSWGDWLGTGKIADNFLIRRPFLEARLFARTLQLNSRAEWQQYYKGKMPEKGKVPNDIPLKPDRRYKNKGWVDWYDWLGTKYS